MLSWIAKGHLDIMYLSFPWITQGRRCIKSCSISRKLKLFFIHNILPKNSGTIQNCTQTSRTPSTPPQPETKPEPFEEQRTQKFFDNVLKSQAPTPVSKCLPEPQNGPAANAKAEHGANFVTRIGIPLRTWSVMPANPLKALLTMKALPTIRILRGRRGVVAVTQRASKRKEIKCSGPTEYGDVDRIWWDWGGC